jgi:C-terminal processing protease CtpA/Prc
LRRRLDENEYEGITSAKKLAEVLTEHLQAVSKDKHLRMFYAYESLPMESDGEGPKPGPEKVDDLREQMRAHGRSLNFGFEKVERLEGNVGYLDLRMFFGAEFGGETASAAMNLLANTDAMIIDLRKNGGGDPDMVALICSYLFGPEPVHLNDIYMRPEDSTHQRWTLPLVPGRRYEGKSVYVLTSKRTFSAAEEFAYNLKCLKRATIVGETTGGGAHPGGMRRISDHFGLFVPSGRAINPITKTNWEGTGVTPDVPVAAERALQTAHLAALKTIATNLVERQKDPRTADPMRVDQVKESIRRLEKELGSPEKAVESQTSRPAK